MALCILSATASAAAQQKLAQPATAPVAAALPPDLSKEALVWEKLYTRIHEEADGTGTRETTSRTRVQAEAGVKVMAVLTFTYIASNQQIDIAYVRVIKPDGTVVVTPDYNIQDLPADVTRSAPMYSDIHQKHVAVKGLGVGDTVEYKVTERTIKPEVPGHFWLEYSFEKDQIILDEQLDLDLPAAKAVTVSSKDQQPTITTAGARKLYHWSSSNLARPDPDAPAKSVKHWKPSVQVTTFASWEQVGAWYQSLQHDQIAVTPAIQSKADALTKGLTGDEAKVRALFDEVALHIHYVGLEFGIGRYQPHPADDVLSNEYGDCKDKHTLLVALLKAEGIEAWPVLIASSRELDPETPSPAQFDHVITVVPLVGKLLWMDSTAEVVPPGILGANLRDKQALAIPPNKSAYLERTAAVLPFAQVVRFEAEGQLSDKGVFTGHIVQSHHGDLEMIFRAAFRQVPQSQWKEFVQQISNSSGFGGDVKNPEVSAIEQTGQPIRFSYDYTRERYSEWDDHRISPPMPSTGWALVPGVKQKKPADDIDAGSPGDQLYTASIKLPEGWMLNPPSGTDLKEDWAEYHSSYGFKSGVFTAERRLSVKKSKIPLDQWDKYVVFRNGIYQDEVRMSGLWNPTAATDVQGASFSASGRFAADSITMDLMQKQIAALQPLREAGSLLGGESQITPDDLNKADEGSRKEMEEIEAKSLTLPSDDAHTLYWAQSLADAWTIRGWVALQRHDLPTAESYLRSAWRLSLDRVSGYLFGQLLEAKGEKAAAAHQYELAYVTASGPSMKRVVASSYDVDRLVGESYRKLTGKELKATALNHGAYEGSLTSELDKIHEFRQFIHSSTLTGSGLYALAFETGQPVKVTFLHGNKGFEALTATLKARTFASELPNGSKARLLREVRLICSPYAGCDAYLLGLSAIELSAPIKINTEVSVLPKTADAQKPAPTESKPGVVDIVP